MILPILCCPSVPSHLHLASNSRVVMLLRVQKKKEHTFKQYKSEGQRRQTTDTSKIWDSNTNMEHTCVPRSFGIQRETALIHHNTLWTVLSLSYVNQHTASLPTHTWRAGVHRNKASEIHIQPTIHTNPHHTSLHSTTLIYTPLSSPLYLLCPTTSSSPPSQLPHKKGREEGEERGRRGKREGGI